MQKLWRNILMSVLCLCLCVGIGVAPASAVDTPKQVSEISGWGIRIDGPYDIPGYDVTDYAVIIAHWPLLEELIPPDELHGLSGIAILTYVVRDKNTGKPYLLVADHDITKVTSGSFSLDALGEQMSEDPVWAKNFPEQVVVPARYYDLLGNDVVYFDGAATLIPVDITPDDYWVCRFFYVSPDVNYIQMIL